MDSQKVRDLADLGDKYYQAYLDGDDKKMEKLGEKYKNTYRDIFT